MNRQNWRARKRSSSEFDPTNWPLVRHQDFSPAKKKRFLQRQRALQLYFAEEVTLDEIVRRTSVSKSEIYRLRDRALTVRDDGQVWGYHACIPGFRIKPYELRSTSQRARAGTVTKFFGEHGELRELIEAWALGRKSPDVGIVRGRHYARIWAGFEKQCNERGITQSARPSREAVRRLCRRIRLQHFGRGAMLEGGKSASTIATTGVSLLPMDRAPEPYARVQLDGHRVDALITVAIDDADGTKRNLPLERVWLLVLVDEASRAVLGYHISLESNYTCEDVLSCIASALTPWSPLELPSCGISYAPGAGLPSGLFPECNGRLFDQLAYDNAMAHTSTWLQERIIDTVGCEINTGRPGRPLTRSIVERFFRTFEETSLHRWPTTTGSNPMDVIRNRPEKAAERLQVTYEDLVVAVDLAIANYNTATHKGLNGRSPLEYIGCFEDSGGAFSRHLHRIHAKKNPLFDREFTRKIAGDVKRGRRPYITFMGASYRNETLVNMVDNIGEKVTLVVNVKDIRTVEAYRRDGSTLGTLTADEQWLRQPHSLRTRRAILKLIRTGQLSREMHNPVGEHLLFLEERARLTRRARNRLVKQALEAERSPTCATQDSVPLAKTPKVGSRRIRLSRAHNR